MENEKKRNNNFKNLFFSIAGLAIIATTICFLFLAGYFEYFNINQSIIFLNKMYDYFMLGVIATYLAIPFLSVYISYKALKITSEIEKTRINIKARCYEKLKLYKITKNFFLNLTKKIAQKEIAAEIVYYIFLNLISAGLIWLLSDLYTTKIINITSNNWILYFIAAISIIIVFLYNKFATDEAEKLYFFTCLFFLVLALTFKPIMDIGYNYAKNAKSFIKTDNYILIYNNDQTGIACEYEINDNGEYIIDNSKYKIIELNGLELQNINLENSPILKVKSQTEENNK